jgi:hypothetical protein
MVSVYHFVRYHKLEVTRKLGVKLKTSSFSLQKSRLWKKTGSDLSYKIPPTYEIVQNAAVLSSLTKSSEIFFRVC